MKLESKLGDFMNDMKAKSKEYKDLKDSIDDESVHFTFSKGCSCETGGSSCKECDKGEENEVKES